MHNMGRKSRVQPPRWTRRDRLTPAPYSSFPTPLRGARGCGNCCTSRRAQAQDERKRGWKNEQWPRQTKRISPTIRFTKQRIDNGNRKFQTSTALKLKSKIIDDRSETYKHFGPGAKVTRRASHPRLKVNGGTGPICMTNRLAGHDAAASTTMTRPLALQTTRDPHERLHPILAIFTNQLWKCLSKACLDRGLLRDGDSHKRACDKSDSSAGSLQESFCPAPARSRKWVSKILENK